MTNREKYAEQIIDIALDSIEIAVDKEGKLCDCNVIRCSDCAWSGKSRCRERFKEWAEQEYVEPTVDWSKVPVDTKVFVRDSDSESWCPRYFAKFEDGKIFAWTNGTTSFSAKGFDDVTWWRQGKLAEDTV